MFNKSSIDVTASNIFDILGTPTYLLVDGKDKDMMILIDDIVHVFSEKEYYNKFNEECKKYEKAALIKATLGMIMYDVMKQDLNGISLHGYFEEEDAMRGTYISAEDIKRNKNVIETAYYIMACAMGEETNEATLYNISNKQFYYFGNPGKETIATEKEVDGQKFMALPIFMTQSAILKAKAELGVELDIGIDTLINIERMASEDFPGFAIDPFGTVMSYIDRESVRVEQQRHMATWTDDSVNSYIKYIANSDEAFVVLSPDCDYKNAEGTPMLIGSPLNEFSLFLFEKKEDADRFVDSRPEPCFGGIRPIGILNPEEQLKEFIENLVSNGIEFIFLNANSDYHLYMKLEELYKIAYGKELTKPEQELEAMSFPLAEDCEDFQKDEKSERLIKHIIDYSSKVGHTLSAINLAYECSAEEMIFATNYINGKILEMINNGKEDNDPDFALAREMHFDCCLTLLNKLMDRGDTYLICENDEPIINNDNSSCCIALSTKYVHDIQHMCPVKISLSLFEDLKQVCDYVTITDGDEIGTTVSVELLCICMQYLANEFEPQKLKFFMHFAFTTNLSIMGIELLYQAVICHKDIFDEIIAMIDNGEKFPEKMIGMNDKTAAEFYNEEGGCSGAYVEFVEYLCDIIPDCE